ncbi:MAG: J domain-containing protein [Deltaproteobacteria bacterium]|nr:J domain-containing protein [Deltaproteobacteria bacterium]
MSTVPVAGGPRDVVVVERSPFTRMAFINLAARLPAGLFLHDSLDKALPTLGGTRPAMLFLARQVLLEASAPSLQDLVGAMAQGRTRCVVLVARGEPADAGGRMALAVDGYLSVPAPGHLLLAAALGESIQDDGFRPGTARAAPVVTPTPFAAAVSMPRTLPAVAPPVDVRPAGPRTLTPVPFPAPVDPAAQAADLRRHRLMQLDLDRLDHFAVLGVPMSAGRREVLSAYLALVRCFHPDLAAALRDSRLAAEVRAVYRRVTDAWTVLGNDAHRADYARRLSAGAPGGRAAAI